VKKLVEATFVSLDGVVESPEQWALPFWGAEHRAYATAQLERYDAFLFGRVTYEKFAASWSKIEGDAYYDAVKRKPKFVASRTLRQTTWNATVLDGDVSAAVRTLKEQPGGDLIKYGNGALDRTLMAHKLIDELHLWVFPVTAGAGGRLFENMAAPQLTLTGSRTFGNGVVQLTYGLH
jgi:dihydrofolate reductase